MKQSMLANVVITATASRGRLRTRNYFPMKTERRREIETISREERAELVARAGRDYVLLATRPECQEYHHKRIRS